MQVSTTERKVRFKLTRPRYSEILLTTVANKDAWKARLDHKQHQAVSDFAQEFQVSRDQARSILAEAGIYIIKPRLPKPEPQTELPITAPVTQAGTALVIGDELLTRLTTIEIRLKAICDAFNIVTA